MDKTITINRWKDGLHLPWWLSTLSQKDSGKEKKQQDRILFGLLDSPLDWPIIPLENQLCWTKRTPKLARSHLMLAFLKQAFERVAITIRPLRVSGQASEWQKEKLFKLNHHIKLHWSSWEARSCQFYTAHGQTPPRIVLLQCVR